jgi:hypothetical protein
MIPSLLLLLPTAAPADDTDARKLARDILTRGAALFDMRDAGAMAATYAGEAEGIVVIKDKDAGDAWDAGHPGTIRDRAGPSERRRASPESASVSSDRRALAMIPLPPIRTLGPVSQRTLDFRIHLVPW